MLMLERKGKQPLLSREMTRDASTRRRLKDAEVNRFYGNLEKQWNRESLHYFGALVVCMSIFAASKAFPVADAQCDVRGHLREMTGYELPFQWDVSTEGNWLQLPRIIDVNSTSPSSTNTLRASFSVCKTVRNVTELIMATRGSPAGEKAISTRYSASKIECENREILPSNVRPMEARMYWRCIFPEASHLNGALYAIGNDESYLAFDAKNPEFESGIYDGLAGAKCHMVPVFGADYHLYLTLLQDGMSVMETVRAGFGFPRSEATIASDRAWRVDVPAKTELVRVEGFEPELEKIEKEHGRILSGPMSDKRMLSIRRYVEYRYSPFADAFVPWVPCSAGEYTNNAVEIKFPRSLSNATYIHSNTNPCKPPPRIADRTGQTAQGHSSVLPTSAVKIEGVKPVVIASNIDRAQKWRVVVSDTAAKEIQHSYKPVEFGDYTVENENVATSAETDAIRRLAGNQASNVQWSHGFCEDVIRPFDTNPWNTSLILNLLAENYVHLESDMGLIARPSFLPLANGQSHWRTLERNVMNDMFDICTRTHFKRSFDVTEASLGQKISFVFDATRIAPKLHIASARLVPKHMQCLAPAIQYTEEIIKQGKERGSDYLTHECLALPSYLDVHYDYAFVPDYASANSSCRNGVIHHRWTGVACGKMTSSLSLTVVRDTEPPALLKEKLSGLRSFTRDGLSLHAVSDCLWPFDDASQFKRVNGRNMFCFKDRVQKRLNPLFSDACQASVDVTVVPLWSEASLLRCSGSGSASPDDLVSGCEILGEVPFKQAPFYNLVPQSDGTDDLCIDLQGWTDRTRLLRIVVAVTAQDACGNRRKLQELQDQLIYTATFMNPSFANLAVARQLYCH